MFQSPRKFHRLLFQKPLRLSYDGCKKLFSQQMELKYTELEKEKILKVMNESDPKVLSNYDIAKGRLKKFELWKQSNGPLKALSDVELIDGFTEKTTKRLFTSILEGQVNANSLKNKIKGQFLHPALSDDVRQECKTVLSVYLSANSVCWCHIQKSNYEVLEWKYHSIAYPDGKRLQITDILEASWQVTNQMPPADIYVMKAEATTLRAAGSDPNNPKIVAVNLQKAQMGSMIIALLNARNFYCGECDGEEAEKTFKNKVYFLRPTLPFRLYGTLVGNEKVSSDQTVAMILQGITRRSSDNSQVYMSERLQNLYAEEKELHKDLMGHCLLLALTFMDLCFYRNQNSIDKLLKQRQ